MTEDEEFDALRRKLNFLRARSEQLAWELKRFEKKVLSVLEKQEKKKPSP